MATKSKEQYVKIPNGVIRDPNLSSLDFVLLIKLKMLQFVNHSDKFMINSKDHIKIPFGVSDNRTIKKSLDNLFRQSYILNEVILDSRSMGEVHLNSELLNPHKGYTCIYTSLLKHTPVVDSTGIRLICYYESYINRIVSGANKFCFCGVDTITKDTGLSNNTIIKYNRLLHDKGLVTVEKHRTGTEYKYDENDKIIFSKYNNHYTVNWDKIV